MSDLDSEMMKRALELARRGDPAPNPHVGCVVADGARILGEGFHEAAGKEHAELKALAAAGDEARGATMYVTLEPCNHDGRTAPCVDAILAAGIGRVLMATRDPNPNVKGAGYERLQEAGVTVEIGLMEKEAKHLIRAWTKFIVTGRAFLALKLAVSLDGRIATRTGESKWITGDQSRAKVHYLRTVHDAVLVGISTVLADDPLLTPRDVEGRSPVRIVLDSRLRLPEDSQLVQTARDVPTCVVTTDGAAESAAQSLEAAGISVIRVPATAEGRCDMNHVLKELALRQVVSVLCEGGAEVAGSLLANRLADEIHVFVAPVLLGPRGRPGAVDWAGPESPSQAPRIGNPTWELCGNDAYVTGSLVYPKKTRTQPG
jgi:diaminohydroxyphosphoribosylaminopyrimidine deaminase/5-amino-6-(5-phosphoribosylamino)uracil reductase